ncbi:polysaccharide deacetylase family protein [Phenylobacterium sp.]|uniref:polysaccharide deacetylase family protein n=1 Tax=Phenylobacterium sp. TaxID=1871053 RepID=UPI002F93E9E3
MAVTIDDFEIKDTPRLSGAERHAAILAALERHGIKAAGFVAGTYADNPAAQAHLRAWSAQGHLIGNHTYSHPYYGGKNPAGFMAEVLKAEAVLAGLPTYRKLFRFPYLAEGRTAEGRDAMRALLRQHGYRNAPVSIDTSDWYVNSRLLARLKADPGADLAPYRRYYLDHLWDRAAYYEGLHQALFGRPGVHVLLLHHNLINGLFLDDALAQFSARGWRLVDAEAALADPLYSLAPDTAPAGQSVLWALAKLKGGFDLRDPGEDGAYEQPAMDRLGL